MKGIDFSDGTPILDIKGYRPEYRVDEFDLPAWYKKLRDAADIFRNRMRERFCQ